MGERYAPSSVREVLKVKNGLILEGGGMRGMYTAGVLDCFMEEGIVFDYVIGSSSGVCNAMNYVSGQIGRSRDMMLLPKKESYAGVKEFILHGSFLNLKKLFRILPYQKKTRFDFDTYFTSSIENEFVVSNCLTGKPEYLSETKDEDRLATIATASCSLPVVGRAVKTEDTWYMDGSMTDPIPVQRALDKGCDKVILISTKGEGMDPSDLSKYNWFLRLQYGKKFKPFLEVMKGRLDLYWKQWDMIYDLEKQGRLFLIQPQGELAISHLETDREKLKQMYDFGYAYGKSILEDTKKFLEG